MNEAKTPGRLNITLDQLPAAKCEQCGGEVFMEGVMLREISPIISGERETKLAPIPVFICSNCRTTLEKYLPKELRKKNLVVQ